MYCYYYYETEGVRHFLIKIFDILFDVTTVKIYLYKMY